MYGAVATLVLITRKDGSRAKISAALLRTQDGTALDPRPNWLTAAGRNSKGRGPRSIFLVIG